MSCSLYNAAILIDDRIAAPPRFEEGAAALSRTVTGMLVTKQAREIGPVFEQRRCVHTRQFSSFKHGIAQGNVLILALRHAKPLRTTLTKPSDVLAIHERPERIRHDVVRPATLGRDLAPLAFKRGVTGAARIEGPTHTEPRVIERRPRAQVVENVSIDVDVVLEPQDQIRIGLRHAIEQSKKVLRHRLSVDLMHDLIVRADVRLFDAVAHLVPAASWRFGRLYEYRDRVFG